MPSTEPAAPPPDPSGHQSAELSSPPPVFENWGSEEEEEDNGRTTPGPPSSGDEMATPPGSPQAEFSNDLDQVPPPPLVPKKTFCSEQAGQVLKSSGGREGCRFDPAKLELMLQKKLNDLRAKRLARRFSFVAAPPPVENGFDESDDEAQPPASPRPC
jgi:hypothetical protein